jgi:uncharacterized protein YutE (UPF0331/DUF86 family)
MDITPIVARLSVIADSVNALKALQSLTYEEFAHDHILHSSAERDFQIAIQAILDIGAMLLAELSAKVPEDYTGICLGLAEVGILPADFAQKLVGMAKFRNVLVHLYLEVDLRRVYHYLQHNLGDFELFAQYISEYLAKLK